MLGRCYRFVAYNALGQTILQNNITVKSRRWKWSAGVKSYEASEGSPYTMDAGGGLTTTSYDAGDTVDNSSDLWDGGDFELTVIAPASSNGDVILYYQTSTDGGTTWPDNGFGVPVAMLNFTTNGTKVQQFSL